MMIFGASADKSKSEDWFTSEDPIKGKEKKDTKKPEEVTDWAAWNSKTSDLVNGHKEITDFMHWFVLKTPNWAIKKLTSNYANSLKCMVHYLNGSGEDLKIALSKSEWEFLLNQTKIGTEKSESDEYFKYNMFYKYSSLSSKSCDSFGNIYNYRDALQKLFKLNNIDLDELYRGMAVGETRQITLKYLDVLRNTSIESIHIKPGATITKEEWKDWGEKGTYLTFTNSYGMGFSYPERPSEEECFKRWLLKKGVDLDKIGGDMSAGDKLEILVDKKDGKIPYIIEKKAKENRANHVYDEHIEVFFNRAWVPSSDGWERRYMVTGGVNDSNLSNQFADLWSTLGYTTIARKKVPNEGYDYKIEETFDFIGSVSTNSESVYGRVVSDFAAKQIKKLFPNFISIQKQGVGTSISINSKWVETAGKPFKIITDARTDKRGNIIEINGKSQLPPPISRMAMTH